LKNKDNDLAHVYHYGSLVDQEKRITSHDLVRWFRKNVTLKQRCCSFKPNIT